MPTAQFNADPEWFVRRTPTQIILYPENVIIPRPPQREAGVRTHVNVPEFGTEEFFAFVRAENARLNGTPRSNPDDPL